MTHSFPTRRSSDLPPDLLLLEVGLGGRLDATNVIDKPRPTAITPIALDHQQFLGTTLEAIAGEKAGIMKPGVTCVVGQQEPEILALLERRAQAIAAPLFACGRDWRFTATAGGLRYEDAEQAIDLPKPSLRSEEHTSELQSLMRISYADFCLKK